MSGYTKQLSLLVTLLVTSAAASAFEDSWHIAIGTGVSQLSPGTIDSGVSLEDDQSTATGINIGYDLNPIITTELGLTTLGSASLSADREISYQALSVGAVAYVLGEKEAQYRQDGLSAYFRLGFSAMDNDTEGFDGRLAESNNRGYWLGLGAQWPINQRWSLRGEWTGFDTDASAVMASLVWRARSTRSGDRSPVTAASVSEQQLQQHTQNDNQTASQTKAQPGAERSEVEPGSPSMTAASDADPALMEASRQAGAEAGALAPVSTATRTGGAERRCFSSPMRAEISQSACQVLDGVLAGLDFKPETSQITLLGRASLDRVASALKRYPRVIVELQAHTQTFSETGKADQLSRERVVNVAKYLISQGVAVRQLRARSYGSTRPRSDNSTPTGRRANDRVELKLL